MVVGIIANEDRDIGYEYTKKVVEFLNEKDITPIVLKKMGLSNMKVVEYDINALVAESDFVITLGGDGTMLRLAQQTDFFGTNILGINLGNLGYLTDCEAHDGLESIQKVLDGNYHIEKRMMLQCKFGDKVYQALNDVCIIKGVNSKIISIDVEINNSSLDKFRADGIIISTPTGSTAYNLSAGGPVLKPDGNMIAITPVAPHSLYSRPVVVSSSDKIKIKVENCIINDVVVVIDGNNVHNIKKNEQLLIEKSEYYTNIIKTTDYNFYDVLKLKMRN